MSATDPIFLWVDLLKIVIPAAITFLAGWIGVRSGLKQLRVQKGLDFIEKQLKDFYSPLLGYRNEIRIKSELRQRISELSNEAWQELCKKHEGDMSWNHDKSFEPFDKIITYNNEQLTTELLPQYRKILEVFRDNIWLSEPETREWYKELCEFVEVWNRSESKSLPAGVLRKLEHREYKLQPFYDHLEEQIDILQNYRK